MNTILKMPDYALMLIKYRKENIIVPVYFDLEFIDIISKYNWSINKRRSKYYYIETKINNKTVDIHRLITNCPKELEVDHIDRNPANNRLNNLRCVSRNVNIQNRKYKPTTTGVVGINYRLKNGKYNEYSVRVKGKTHRYFKTYEEAIKYLYE